MDERIEAILEWAKKVPSFDTEFVESLEKFESDHGYLTSKQSDALDSIIDKFNIEV